MSLGQIRRFERKEERKKIAKWATGNKFNQGRHHSEETKLKISNSKKGCIAWNKGISYTTKNEQLVS